MKRKVLLFSSIFLVASVFLLLICYCSPIPYVETLSFESEFNEVIQIDARLHFQRSLFFPTYIAGEIDVNNVVYSCSDRPNIGNPRVDLLKFKFAGLILGRYFQSLENWEEGIHLDHISVDDNFRIINATLYYNDRQWKLK